MIATALTALVASAVVALTIGAIVATVRIIVTDGYRQVPQHQKARR